MPLHTRLTAEYGVQVPLVSAGMAFVSRAPLAIAVCQAGGMGTIAGSGMPPALLESEIAAVRAATDRPFAVNLIGRFATDEGVALLAALRVPVVTFFWDEVPAAWVAGLREAGTRVWIQVGSVEEARAAAALGADGIIAQGREAGGHNRSSAGTITLVPAVLDVAGGTAMVLAAGGIADGRGLAAVLALGASGAVLGTRFVASVEADAHVGWQERILTAGVGDTAHHNIFGVEFPDATVRGLRNDIVREWEGRDRPAPYAGLDPGELPVVGTADVFGEEVPLQRFNGLPPASGATGDLDQMSLLAGESSGLIDSVAPAGELVEEIAAEAEAILGSDWGR
jgi:NAD(P)H-dependent flavin oxidoreductase YrpB (nitropropane dioxygenase family)